MWRFVAYRSAISFQQLDLFLHNPELQGVIAAIHQVEKSVDESPNSTCHPEKVTTM